MRGQVVSELYMIDAPAVALSAATAKTLLEVATPSTSTARIVDITFGCDAAVSGTLKVELLNCSATGSGSAYTLKRVNGDAQNRAALTTGKLNSGEPTVTNVLKTWPPMALPGGPFEIQLPLGREIYLPVSTIYAVRLTSSTACNGYANLQIEE